MEGGPTSDCTYCVVIPVTNCVLVMEVAPQLGQWTGAGALVNSAMG